MCSHMVSSLWHIRVLSCNTCHAMNPWHQHPLGWAILRLCQVEPTSGRMTNSLWCILDSSSSLNDSVVKIFQVLFFVLLCNVQVLRAKLKELGGNRDKGYDGTQWHPQTERQQNVTDVGKPPGWTEDLPFWIFLLELHPKTLSNIVPHKAVAEVSEIGNL